MHRLAIVAAIAILSGCASPGGMLGTNADEFVTVVKPDGTKIMWGRNIDQSTALADLGTAIVAGLGIHGRVKIQANEQETIRQTAETATKVPLGAQRAGVASERIEAGRAIGLAEIEAD